jgi:WD40 repeat protein
LLSGSHDKTVRLWDLATGRELQRLEGHTREVYTVAFAPDGRRAVSGGNDRTVRLWLLDVGKELRCCTGHANAVIRAAFTSDGRQVLSASSQYRKGDRILRLWDAESGKEVRPLIGETSERVGCLSFSLDGRSALSGGSDNTLRFWKLPE